MYWPFKIVIWFLSAIALLASNLVLSADFSVSWRSVDSQIESEWTEGRFANLGFTDAELQMRIVSDKPIEDSSVLTLSPSYIDRVEVQFYDTHLRLIKTSIKGDKTAPQNTSTDYDIGLLTFELPEGTQQIKVFARSTSNLRFTADIKDKERIHTQQVISIALKTFIATVVVVSMILVLIPLLIFRSPLYLSFLLYQMSWLALLTGLENIPSVMNNSLYFLSDQLVSFGVITATLLGSATHAIIFQRYLGLKRTGWLLWITAALAGLNWVTFIFIDSRLGLQNNAFVLSVVPVLIILILLIARPRSMKKISLWKSTRIPYLLLMLLVLGSGISGLGLGNLLSVNYTHALITTLILGFILYQIVKAEIKTIQFRADKTRAIAMRNNLLNTELKDTQQLIHMLTHEIKTPITTIKMKLYKSEQRESIVQQLDMIEGILVQSLRALDLEQGSYAPEQIFIGRRIYDQWFAIAPEKSDKIIKLRSFEGVTLKCDKTELDVILRNLLSNAYKYAHAHSKVLVVVAKESDKIKLSVSNSTDMIDAAEAKHVFEKYWRSSKARSNRGTGLGLWIVKMLCKKRGYKVEAKMRGNRFRVTLQFPTA